MSIFERENCLWSLPGLFDASINNSVIKSKGWFSQKVKVEGTTMISQLTTLWPNHIRCCAKAKVSESLWEGHLAQEIGSFPAHGYHSIKELINPFISYLCLEDSFSLSRHEPVYLRILDREYVPETGSVKFSRAGSSSWCHRWMAILELAYQSGNKRPLGWCLALGPWRFSNVYPQPQRRMLRDQKEKAMSLQLYTHALSPNHTAYKALEMIIFNIL